MKKYIYYTLATVSVFMASCDDFGTINNNPNGSVVPLTSALLTNSLTAIGGTVANVRDGLYGQYFSETLYTDQSRYSTQDGSFSEYSGSIEDLQNIININTDEASKVYASQNGSNDNQIGIARILKAYRFSIITDHYGDIPYFDALKPEVLNPAYDDQALIYADLFKELKEGAAQLSEGGAPIRGDILFGGDIQKWKQFANSYRVILALRTSKRAEANGQAQLTDAIASDGGILSDASEDVTLTYPGNSVAFSNPWFSVAGDQNVSATIADHVNETNDPRNEVFGTAVGGTLVGFPYGLQRQEAIDWDATHANNSLVLATPYRLATSTLTILTAADVDLALSEAANLGWIPGPASTYYNKGVRESFEHWGLVTADDQSAYTDYIQQSEINLDSTSVGSVAEKIGTQRWTTFFPNASQGWAEWRRTGFPALVPAPVPVNTSKKIPLRYIYPTVEYGINPDGIAAAIAKLGADTDSDKIWWVK